MLRFMEAVDCIIVGYIMYVGKDKDGTIIELGIGKDWRHPKEFKIFSKEKVISCIGYGAKYRTIIWKEEGRSILKAGPQVEVVAGENEKYLRTDENDIKKDNLGELPEIPSEFRASF